MPLLRKPMELGEHPGIVRRVVRTTLLTAVLAALFVFGLSIVVLALTK